MPESTPLNATVPVVRKDAFLSREMDGDLLLYDRESDAVHTLNSTAGFIYACCDGATSAEEIVRQVAERFGSTREAVREEVEATLSRLQALDSVAAVQPDPVLTRPRREFLATALKGAALLPFVAPTVETMFLQAANAQGPSDPPPPVDPPPTITSCTPDNADQGEYVVLDIRGTDFQDSPTVDLGSGITVVLVDYKRAKKILVSVLIDVSATTGTRDITVTNPDTQSDTLVSGFTVNALPPSAPTVISCTPDNGDLDDRFDVTIAGTNFTATPTVSYNYTKIRVRGVTYISSTTLVVDTKIRSDAVPGSYNVTVTNPDTSSGTLLNGFTVNGPSTPTVTLCSPNNANKNTTLNVTLTGTDFEATPTVDFGAKIIINSVTYISSTTLTVNIKVRKNAASGSRDITVTNPDSGSATLLNGFTVN
jgi:PqqD family protein of HPr-rel-A system